MDVDGAMCNEHTIVFVDDTFWTIISPIVFGGLYALKHHNEKRYCDKQDYNYDWNDNQENGCRREYVIVLVVFMTLRFRVMMAFAIVILHDHRENEIEEDRKWSLCLRKELWGCNMRIWNLFFRICRLHLEPHDEDDCLKFCLDRR